MVEHFEIRGTLSVVADVVEHYHSLVEKITEITTEYKSREWGVNNEKMYKVCPAREFPRNRVQ